MSHICITHSPVYAQRCNFLKQELNGTKAYEETSKDEKSVVYSHLNDRPNKFAVDINER